MAVSHFAHFPGKVYLQIVFIGLLGGEKLIELNVRGKCPPTGSFPAKKMGQFIQLRVSQRGRYFEDDGGGDVGRRGRRLATLRYECGVAPSDSSFHQAHSSTGAGLFCLAMQGICVHG